MKTISALFKRRRFDRGIIMLCVRWYVSYKLSYRDLVEMMGERGLSLSHTTILRWTQRFVPAVEAKFRRYAKPVGKSWRVDETYIKVKGQWVYLYRAVDKAGKTVDFYLSLKRDIKATKRFFRKAIHHRGEPTTITLDGYEASHQAVASLKDAQILPEDTKVRSNKYLNNLIEQDHRRIKQRTRLMLGFKNFANARRTPAGIELAA
jgi:transposase-like protein